MTETLAAALLIGLSMNAFAADASRPAVAGEGETPLHLAAIKGDTKRVGKLLDAGAPVDGVNARGQTALHEAAGQSRSRERTQARVIALLLDRGASVNALDGGGATPLHGAAARGNGALVKLFLARGAKAEAADKNGMTPLMWASAGEDPGGLVEALLKAGAKVDSVSNKGHTPLHLANANGRTATAALLRSRGAAR